MSHYIFHDLSLDVGPDEMEARARLPLLWSNLSLVRSEHVAPKSLYQLSIRLHGETMKPPPGVRPLFQVEGYSALDNGESFYLTDNSSVFHLQPASGRGDAYLAPSFFSKPDPAQCNFWSFGLLKLLRPLKFYSLHCAGLITPEGQGLLVVGPSGSGKSTLALGLIRRGWRYLTDDAVLLHPLSDSVHAFALREHFYVDASAASANGDLPLGGVVADNSGGQRRRVRLDETGLRDQRSRESIPELLLFSRIVPQDQSALVPMDDSTALKHLLEASGPQLFDHHTMGQHLDVLRRLSKQSASFELRAGTDLYRDPSILLRLLSDAQTRRQHGPHRHRAYQSV